MNLKMLKAALTGLILSVSSFANAGLINFNDLTATFYGNESTGASLLSNMNGNTNFISYEFGGFLVTLNAPSATWGAHIGDAGPSGTFNWHTGGDNGNSTFATLTKIGGGMFNLVDFDYSADSNFTLDAAGYASSNLTGNGTSIANLNNVTSVSFTASSGGFMLDNLNVVSSVPEPTTLAIFGLGLLGLASRRSLLANKK
jgi:hypothetical protein